MCILGGRSRRSFPIITFPECSISFSVTDKQHANVVKYLTNIPAYVILLCETFSVCDFLWWMYSILAFVMDITYGWYIPGRRALRSAGTSRLSVPSVRLEFQHRISKMKPSGQIYGYRSIRPSVDPPRVDPPHVRPKRGRSTPSSGTFRPGCWDVPPQHPISSGGAKVRPARARYPAVKCW